MYVFTMFHTESKNVLPSGFWPETVTSKFQTKSAADFLQRALTRTINNPPGNYDMFLRFLCGLLSPDCHNTQLNGYLYHYNTPKMDGLGEVQLLLEQAIQTAPMDRVENLKECLREMTQEDK